MKLPLTPIRCLLRAAAEYGGKVGVVDGDRRLTYNEVWNRSCRLAAALKGLGLAEGDRAATLSFNSHHLLEAYYGLPIARAILLSLNVRLTAEEQAYILQHSGSKIVMFDPEFLPVVEGLRKELPALRWISLMDSASLPKWVHEQSYEELVEAASPVQVDFTTYDEDSIAELFYTSGSTGQPKGVMLSHRTLYLHALNCLLGTLRSGPKRPPDQGVTLHTIPLFHANGWGQCHTVTFMGGRHVMMKRFGPAEVCRLIQQEGVTNFGMVPTMANALVHYPDIEKFDLTSVEDIMIGGAPPSQALVRAVEEKLGCRCLVGYGLTETSPVAAHAHIKSTLGELDREERLRRQSMTGCADPGVEMRVADDAGNDVPRDMETMGEILFRGDVVMDGYWNEPEATSGAIEDNWLHTGDMAVWDEDGYALIVDRKKDVIISGGENISSIEIEKVLAHHPGIFECAVVGVPDEKWGEVPKAFVVLKPGEEASAEDIQGFVREHLAGFKVPKSVEFKDELPKGATGKILKRALRDAYWEGTGKHVQGTGTVS